VVTCIALLCGINVGGNRKVPMVDLRALASEIGFKRAATYIQSGNLVFVADSTPRASELKLEAGMVARFGFTVEVLVRTLAEWEVLLGNNPFPAESAAEANRVMLLLSRSPPKPDAVTALRSRAKNGERVESGKGAVWVYYREGAGTSKLTPALVDKAIGSKVTARNWRTVIALRDLALEVARHDQAT